MSLWDSFKDYFGIGQVQLIDLTALKNTAETPDAKSQSQNAYWLTKEVTPLKGERGFQRTGEQFKAYDSDVQEILTKLQQANGVCYGAEKV